MAGVPDTSILGTIPTTEEVTEILKEMDKVIRTEVDVDELKDISKGRKKTGSELVEDIESSIEREP